MAETTIGVTSTTKSEFSEFMRFYNGMPAYQKVVTQDELILWLLENNTLASQFLEWKDARTQANDNHSN